MVSPSCRGGLLSSRGGSRLSAVASGERVGVEGSASRARRSAIRLGSSSAGKIALTYAASSSGVATRAGPPTASIAAMNSCSEGKRRVGSLESAVRQTSSRESGTEGLNSVGRRGLPSVMRFEHLLGVEPGEGPPAAELLVEHHAGGEEIRPVVHVVPGDHLRGHVEELALQGPGLGAARHGGRLGDAEVDHLHLAGDADVDVVGGEVAVDDLQLPTPRVLRPVRGVEPAAGLGEHPQGDAQRNPAGPSARRSAAARRSCGPRAAPSR